MKRDTGKIVGRDQCVVDLAGLRSLLEVQSQPDRFAEKLSCFLEMCFRLAELSTCKRARVGAMLLSPNLAEVYALGYNGPATGLPNESCTGEVGACGCVHAEANALVKATGWGVLFTTTSPCLGCAKLIANSRRVIAIVSSTEYRDPSGRDVLSKAGIKQYVHAV